MLYTDRIDLPAALTASPMRLWLEREKAQTEDDLDVAVATGNAVARLGCVSDLRILAWLLSSLDKLEEHGEPDDADYADWYAANAEPSGFTI